LKQAIKEYLASLGDEIIDVGTDSEAPVDYPIFCATAARHATRGTADFAIVIGGSGQGEAIAANKVRGARAALCQDEAIARLARQHNDANVLSMGARIIALERAISIVDTFRTTAFEDGRHVARLAQIAEIELAEAAESR
jgi:ribose 5-phosphate isomerase B